MKQMIVLLLVVFLGCRNTTTRQPSGAGHTEVVNHLPSVNGYVADNIKVVIQELRTCRYPAKDPLFQQKEHMKLILIQVSVTIQSSGEKEDAIPLNALLYDGKGNKYTNSPGIVAMAQSSGCIAGDDLKMYNAIWNGDMQPDKEYTAFVLGYELPEDAYPAKLYWNKRWLNNSQFIEL